MVRYRIREFRAKQIGQWLACGYRFWRRQPLANTTPYAALAFGLLLLHIIPVIGDVALLMLLPSLLASVLLHAHLTARPAPPAPPTPKTRPRKLTRRERLVRWLNGLRPMFFGAWSRQENVIPLLLVGFVLVVLGLLAHVLVNKVGGQALSSLYGFTELGIAQQARILLAYASGILFWATVGALVHWTLPLFAIADLPLLSAQRLGAQAAARNAGIVLVYLLLLVALLVPGMMLRLGSPVIGLIVLWLGLTVAAMLVVFSGYCSFRLVFADDSGPRTPANGPATVTRPAGKPS